MTEPIRILYLIDKLEAAGTQSALLELVRHLNRAQFKPYVIALVKGGGLTGEFTQAGVPPQVLSVRKLYGVRAMKALPFLVNFMRKERIDIVHTYFLHADVLGTIAAKLAGVKKIIFARRDEGFWRGKIEFRLNRYFNGHADYILANSEAVRRAVRKLEQVPAEKIAVIHNGIDGEEFMPSDQLRFCIRQSLGALSGDVVVGTVANMRHPVKGYPYLIDAIPKVVAQAPQTKFWLVGEGILRRQYEARVRELGVENCVKFLGVRRDIPALLNGMDIFCQPSLTEGFSNAILEAMGCAKPVIATGVGGNPEIVSDGLTGYLVPPKDTEELAERLTYLSNQAPVRDLMGQAARARILEKFTIEQMAGKYEQLYLELVEGLNRT